MKKVFVIVVTICLSVSLLLFVRNTDIHAVTEAVSNVGYRFNLLLLTTFIAYLFGTISWHYLLGNDFKKISLVKLFLIRHVGETVSLFNPASVIGGDAVKTMMMSHYGIDRKRVLLSVFVSRLVLVFTQLFLFVCALAVIVIKNPDVTMLSLGRRTESGLMPLLAVKWKALRVQTTELWADLPVLLRENRFMLVVSFSFALLHWILGSLEFYLILKFLGLKVTVAQALLVDMGVVFFKAAGSFIPGQLGVEEYGNKIMLLAIGLPGTHIWVTASILRRARQLVWVGFGILVYFLLFHKRKAALSG